MCCPHPPPAPVGPPQPLGSYFAERSRPKEMRAEEPSGGGDQKNRGDKGQFFSQVSNSKGWGAGWAGHSGTPRLRPPPCGPVPAPASRTRPDLHAVAARDDADVNHVQEEAVVHHALQCQDGLGGCHRGGGICPVEPRRTSLKLPCALAQLSASTQPPAPGSGAAHPRVHP